VAQGARPAPGGGAWGSERGHMRRVGGLRPRLLRLDPWQIFGPPNMLSGLFGEGNPRMLFLLPHQFLGPNLVM
jgi:hypothetical protein